MKNRFDLIEYLTEKREHGKIIWLFNIGTEKYWNNENFSLKDINENQIVNHMEEMNLLLTRKQDVLLLRTKPDKFYLKQIEKAGFDIPKIVCPKYSDNDDRPIAELVLEDDELLEFLKKYNECNEEVYFVPYGVSKLEESIANKCGLKLIGASSELNKKINNKVFSRELSEKLGMKVTQGAVCHTLDEIKEKYTELKVKHDKIIIKQPSGASGKGLYIVDSERKLKSILMVLQRFIRINNESEWIVEGWYEKKVDINYQIYVNEKGRVITFSIKEQLVDETVYVGSVMPPRISDEIRNKYLMYGDRIGKALYEQGFTGVLGVDSIITTDDEVIPIIEINARFTLSTYISMLPVKFPNRIMYSFYEKLKLADGVNYEKVVDSLQKKQLLFNIDTAKGVLCYVSETIKDRTDSHNGRFFAIIVGNSMDENEKIRNIVNDIINNIRRYN